MAGTLANPVMLDPFQAITEVGWPSIPTHIAFRLQIGEDNTAAQDFTCDGTMPEPAGPYRSVYAEESHYEYTDPSGSGAVTAVWLRIGGGWGASSLASSVGVEVSALPTLPSFAFGYFQHVGGGQGGVNGFSIAGPAVRWTPPSGAELGIVIPSAFTTDKFLAVTAATLDLFGDTFTGEPSCIEGFGSLKYAECTGAEVGVEDHHANAVDLSAAHELSISGMSATYQRNGSTLNYLAKGVRLTDGDDYKGGKNGDARLWVLLEREDLAGA